jgi:hypothetical protein
MEASVRRFMLAPVIVAFLAMRVVAFAGTECGGTWYYPYLLAEKDPQGYSIRFADPAKVRKELNWGGTTDRASASAGQLPPHRLSIIPTAEHLSREAGAMAFYVGRPDAQLPISLDAVWRGPDPLSCLRSFAQAAGLDVVAPQPGFWLVGVPGLLVSDAIEVFAYSPDTKLQPLKSEAEVRALERALLAALPVREIGPHALVGLAYWWVSGEPDTLLVVATHGANTNPSDGDDLEVAAYKVRVHNRRGSIAIECVWKRWMDLWGPLLPGIHEDFDGDGLQDFYFQEAGDRDKPDVIVSGADGSTIAKLNGESIAVPEDRTGPRLFGFREVWGSRKPGGHSAVWRYSKQTKRMELAWPLPSPDGGTDRFAHEWEEPGDVLAKALGGPEAVRVYALPGFEVKGVDGGEYIMARSSSVWDWFVNRNLKWTLDNPPPSRLAVHVVFRYLSPGYLEERQKQKASARP